uniref:F-box only protein 42 n=1 Tax=Lygus hesperus TaxID=30085 RepID=A0A0A9YZ53_LYGHE
MMVDTIDRIPLEQNHCVGICDLPNEILEHIISLLLPYNDLENCMLVCKRWHRCGQNVIRHKKLDFYKAIGNFTIKWSSEPQQQSRIITKRYSHSACSHGNSMYVFGGCTCTNTTFNDLWKLDLTTRQWSRLLTMGSYPSPKASASLVYYDGSLVLFGGWTHPSSYLPQAWRTFNELHIYDIEGNRWTSITPPLSPPSMAGHAATVHGDNMVVFGGLQGHNGGLTTFSSNNVWSLNLKTLTWTKRETTEKKPFPRYGHSQIAVDEERLFILGGWAGPPSAVMVDIWMLTMVGRIWVWTSIVVNNRQWAASHLWCHPACKVEDYVVVMSRNPESTPTSLAYSRWTSNSHIGGNQNRRILADELRAVDQEVNLPPPIDRDVNVNGRRGSLGRFHQQAPPVVEDVRESPREIIRPILNNAHYMNNMIAFKDNRPTVHRNREKQLDAIKRMEERLRSLIKPQEKIKKKAKPPKMAMFVLDISRLLDEKPEVSWLPIKSVAMGSPEPTILYTLVRGKGELIMFGGIKKDANALANQSPQVPSDTSDTVSDTLHFITASHSSI